jgi:DedD protein
MAFFKFRKGGDDQSASPPPAQSVEALRKRAKHRLIGSAILVLIGVVGFPLLVDKQPRPIAVDIPIDIPDRNKVKPLPAPVPVTPPQAEKAPVVEPAAAPQPKPEPPAEPKPEPKAEPKPAEKEKDKPAAKADTGAKAKALLEGKEPSAASGGRIVVQVGAFADPAKAREVRHKLERAGLKTYTHVAETKEGRRIRVRVGPFATRAEAEKAAEKIRKLDLPVAILTL